MADERSKIEVAIRVRPLNKTELSARGPNGLPTGMCWKVVDNCIIQCPPSTIPSTSTPRYAFDHVYDTDVGTDSMYEATTKHIILSAVTGFNGTVFAYGQTSSGKTHTMRGSDVVPGIIPLAVSDAFQTIEAAANREFLVRVSYMEIYNEDINDLLVPKSTKLQVHETIERGVFVAGLREEIVTCAQDVMALMTQGEENRHFGKTNMNEASSRSHTIFRMVVESRERADDDYSNVEETGCEAVRVSTLNLVDLAGSERISKTGAEGLRMKEGAHINKSLMYLGQVIKKLAEGVEKSGGHINYRDSKLTRILQNALGGNSKTAIICCVSPAAANLEETKSTLLFAERAKKVTTSAHVNEVLTDEALMRRQKKEIQELRKQLQATLGGKEVEQEINRLRQGMLEMEQDRLRMQYELEERKALDAAQQLKIENLKRLVLADESYRDKLEKKQTSAPGAKAKSGRRYTTFAGIGKDDDVDEDLGAKRANNIALFSSLLAANNMAMGGPSSGFLGAKPTPSAGTSASISEDETEPTAPEASSAPDAGRGFVFTGQGSSSGLSRVCEDNEEEDAVQAAGLLGLPDEEHDEEEGADRLGDPLGGHVYRSRSSGRSRSRSRSQGRCSGQSRVSFASDSWGSDVTFDDQITELQVKLHETELLCLELEGQLEAARARIEVLETQDLDREDRPVEQDELQGALARIGELTEQVRELTIERSAMERELGYIDMARQQVHQLQAQLQESSAKLDEAESGRKAAVNKAATLHERIVALEVYENKVTTYGDPEALRGQLEIMLAAKAEGDAEVEARGREHEAFAQAKQAEVASWAQKCQELEAQLATVTASLQEQAARSLEELEAATADALLDRETALAALEAERAAAVEAREAVGALERAMEAAAAAAREEVAVREQHCTDITAELEALELVKSELEASLETSKAAALAEAAAKAELERAHGEQVAVLEAELNGLKKELKGAAKAPKDLARVTEELRKEMDKGKAKLAVTEAKLKLVVQEKNKLQSEKANAERELRSLQGQSSALKLNLDKRESLADKKRESIAASLNKTKSAATAAEGRLKAATLELEKATFDNIVLKSEKDSLAARVTELEEEVKATTEHEQALSSECAALREELAALAEALGTARQDAAGLKAALEASTREAAAKEEAWRETENILRAEHAQVVEQLLDAHMQLETGKAKWDADAKQKMEELSALQAALASQRTEYEASAHKAALAQDVLRAQALAVSDARDALSNKADELAALVAAKEKELSEAEASIKALREDLLSLQANLGTSLEQQAVLGVSLERSQAEVTQKEADIAQREAEMAAYEQANGRLEERLRALAQREAEMAQQVEAFGAVVSRLQGELQASQAQSQQLAAAKELLERQVAAQDQAWQQTLQRQQQEVETWREEADVQKKLGRGIREELEATKRELAHATRQLAQRPAQDSSASKGSAVADAKMQERLDTLEQQCREYEDEIGALKAAAEEALLVEERELALQVANRGLEKKLARLEEQLALATAWKEPPATESSEALAAAKKALSASQAEQRKYAARLKELEDVAAAHPALKQELKEARVKAQRLEEVLAALRKDVAAHGPGALPNFDKYEELRNLEWELEFSNGRRQLLKNQLKAMEEKYKVASEESLLHSAQVASLQGPPTVTAAKLATPVSHAAVKVAFAENSLGTRAMPPLGRNWEQLGQNPSGKENGRLY